MSNDTDELAVADHFLEVVLDGLLAQIIGPLLGGLGESLLLARVPFGIRRMNETGLQFIGRKDKEQRTVLIGCAACSWDVRALPSGEPFLKPCSPEFPAAITGSGIRLT